MVPLLPAAETERMQEDGLEGGVMSPCLPGLAGSELCARVEQQQGLASAEHDVQVAVVVLRDEEPGPTGMKNGRSGAFAQGRRVDFGAPCRRARRCGRYTDRSA